MHPLTEKQQRLLEFLKAYQAKHGHAPTQVEIQAHFQFKSLGTVQDYLQVLENKQAITRQSGKWSGITLLHETLAEELPLLGKVAAGQPIAHLKTAESITVPPTMLRGSGPHFALQVVGDSMIDEGIFENDYVIVRNHPVAEVGQIVVALIDGEATIKRYYRSAGSSAASSAAANTAANTAANIELRSANARYAPIIVTPEQEFKIAGIYCGLIRYSH